MATIQIDIESNAGMEYEPLPEGWYLVTAIDEEVKTTKTEDGKYIQITFEILEGKHKGRRLIERYNYINDNGMAVEMARKALATLAQATGMKGDMIDTSQILRRPVAVNVKISPAKGNYGPQNRIVTYKMPKPDTLDRHKEASSPRDSYIGGMDDEIPF